MGAFHFKFRFPQLASASGFFFCHNCNHSLTNSYIFVFHCSIAQTTPQLVCMWSVMKSPVKPAWIKWKLGMFSSCFFPRPSYRMVYHFQFSNLRTKSYVVTIQMKTLWLNFWKVLFISMDFARRWVWNFVILREKCSIKRQNMFTWHTTLNHVRLRCPLFPASTYMIF